MSNANRDVKLAAAGAGVCLWQIAQELGILDSNFSRKLRRELPQEEKAKIFPWEYKQILYSIIMNAPTISVKEDNEEFGKLPDNNK